MEESTELAPIAEYALYYMAGSTLLSCLAAYLAFLKNRPPRKWASLTFMFIFPVFILMMLKRDDNW